MGIFVIKAASRKEAEAIADADPFHANGVRTYEMLDWDVHQIMGAGAFSRQAFGSVASDHPERYPSMKAIGGH